MNAAEFASKISSGDRRALARAITLVENGHQLGKEIINILPVFRSKSHIIGITGPPGSGKSTLVDQLIGSYRLGDKTVAVLAVDPTSPFSGGALLGDRIRMLSRTSDPGVYIRSVASRGRLGGLSPHTFDVLVILQHAGFDKIIVETVGAGQSEVDVIRAADTTMVLAVPGLGDDIQVIKAGIMEIADLFAVNKADLPDARPMAVRIRNMLELVPSKSKWIPPVLEVSALKEMGIDKLLGAIESHYKYLISGNLLHNARKERLKFELMNKYFHHLSNLLPTQSTLLDSLAEQLLCGESSMDKVMTQINDYFLSQSNN